MVLATHVVVAGVLTRVGYLNPVLAFGAGFVSHFLLDAIPHWDYPLRSVGRPARLDFGKIVLDVVIGLGLLQIFLPSGLTLASLSAAAGAILPDALQFLYHRFNLRGLRALQSFHEWIHTRQRIYNHFWGVVSQGFFVTLVIWLSFRL